jgi:hypothetical protein
MKWHWKARFRWAVVGCAIVSLAACTDATERVISPERSGPVSIRISGDKVLTLDDATQTLSDGTGRTAHLDATQFKNMRERLGRIAHADSVLASWQKDPHYASEMAHARARERARGYPLDVRITFTPNQSSVRQSINTSNPFTLKADIDYGDGSDPSWNPDGCRTAWDTRNAKYQQWQVARLTVYAIAQKVIYWATPPHQNTDNMENEYINLQIALSAAEGLLLEMENAESFAEAVCTAAPDPTVGTGGGEVAPAPGTPAGSALCAWTEWGWGTIDIWLPDGSNFHWEGPMRGCDHLADGDDQM